PDGPDDETEFVELLNVGTTPALLNGAHFTAGIGFTFGNLTLAPGQTVVLVRNSAAFSTAYPGIPVGGVFSDYLDNGGETITLRDIAERVIFSVDYRDSNTPGWPVAADGDGGTLVLRRPFSTSTNPLLPSSWRSGMTIGGRPGIADSTVFLGDPNADIDKDGFNALMEYGLGTSDTDPNARPQLEMTRLGSGQLSMSFLHPEAADDVTIEGLESGNLGSWSSALAQGTIAASSGWLQSTWKSSASGPSVYLRVRVRWE
ncbi:MAG TPA: lamin tail domain-containing protein, partial [Chthoniobacteraceae bacterium]|nr:lamin tail domain-containing protein [Chthoniobacteraceae bacterium]